MCEQREAILVIDDDKLFRKQFQDALKDLGCNVRSFSDLKSAQKYLSSGFSPTLIFADRWIRGKAIEERLLQHIKQASPNSHVVIYTRIDELTGGDVSRLLSMGVIRVLDRREIADSVESILQEFKELRDLSRALDDFTRGRSDMVTALVGANVGMTMIDRQYNCWFANSRQHGLIGGQCTGGLYWALFFGHPAECGPPWGCGIKDVFNETQKGVPIHRTILTHLHDDRVLWLSIQTKAIRNSDERIIAVTEAVSTLDQSFMRNMEPTECLFGIVRGLVHAGFGRVRIYELHADTKTLKLRAAAARTDVFEAKAYFESVRDLELDYTMCPYVTRAVESKAGLLIDRWDEGDSPFKISLKLCPPYFLVPMWSGKHLVGLLGADFGEWDEVKRPVAIKHLARQENLRWIREGYAQEAQMKLAIIRSGTAVVSPELFARQQAALRARQRIGAASSLDEAITALREGFKAVGPDCQFFVRRKLRNRLATEIGLDVPEGLSTRDEITIDDPNSLSAYVLSTYMRPLWIDDYQRWKQKIEEFHAPAGTVEEDIRSIARIPLRFEATTYGVLGVESENVHRWWEEGFVEPLMSLAEHAALIVRDIGIRDDAAEARARIEEAKRLELQMIANVAEYLPLCVFVKNRDHVFRYVNKRFCEDVGMQKEEVIGKTDEDIFGQATAAIYQRADNWVMDTGNTYEDTDEPHPTKRSEQRAVYVVKTPFQSSSGEIEGVVGAYWDVTETNRWFHQLKSWRDGLRSIAGGSGRAGEVSSLHRLFMLAVTHGQCLGFSRAILFLPSDIEGRFVARLAVGSTNQSAAQKQWKKKVPFEEAVSRCLRPPAPVNSDDLQSRVDNLIIDINKEMHLANDLYSGKLVIRRQAQPSPIQSSQFAMAIQSDGEDVEYVLAPLREEAGKLTAILWADRAFLDDPKVHDTNAQHFDILWAETVLMATAIQSGTEETRIAHDIARGISYALRTRTGILEFNLFRLKQKLGSKHREAVESMEYAVEFFKRTAAITTGCLRLSEGEVPGQELINLNTVVQKTVEHCHFPGSCLKLLSDETWIRANPHRVEDILLELLINARDFAERKNPRIEVTISLCKKRAKVEVNDNGKGIHPELRPNLFGMFKCHPADRLGLGLYYARTLARAYGGDLDEIGRPGNGAHFVLTFPAMKPSAKVTNEK